MKLLVVGASNEIMAKGYVYSIGATEILNASSGGCGISAGVINYLKHQQPKADFALLSFELNEHGIIRNGFRSKAEVIQLWDWLLCKLMQSATYPVITVLPRLEYGKIVRTSTCDLHKDIAARHGAAFVDIAALFVTAQAGGIPQERLMKDNAHMQEDVAQIVGRHIGNYLTSLTGTLELQSELDWDLATFAIVPAARFQPQGSVIFRKTSLTTAELVAFDEGDAFDIPGESGDTLLALSINRCSMPGAALTLGNSVKPLFFTQAKPDGYMNVVVDMSGGIGFDSPVLRGVVGPCNLNPTEATWLGGPVPDGSDLKGRVEIESALVRKAARQVVTVTAIAPPETHADFASTPFADQLIQDLVAL